MKKNIKLLSLFMACLMVTLSLLSCSNDKDNSNGSIGGSLQESENNTTVSETETNSESSLETETNSESSLETETHSEFETTSESETSNDSECVSDSEIDSSTETSHSSAIESNTESETSTESESETNAIMGEKNEYSEIIENANELKNQVNASYDATRDHYTLENEIISFKYDLSTAGNLCATVSNKRGNTYVSNTMDVFIKMKNGNTFYSSDSFKSAQTNIFRYGYYYYDAHIYNQSFKNGFVISNELPLDLSFLTSTNDLARVKNENGVITATVKNSTDPYISGKVDIDAETYNAVRVTMSTTATTANIYFKVGDSDDFKFVTFDTFSDGERHTYTVPLDVSLTNPSADNGYSGKLIYLRVDLNGVHVGDTFEISEFTAIGLADKGSPNVVMDRNMHVYSDKLHQTIRLIALSEVNEIDSVGMVTRIPAEIVDKIFIKDKNGTHTSLDGVTPDDIEYLAFDIKDVGIFGYIMPADNASGELDLSLEDGYWVITQTVIPDNGTIKAIVPASSTGESAVASYIGESMKPYASENDLVFGHRIYTDNDHSFDGFIYQAELERNPLTNESIIINTDKTPNVTYDGYDALRGLYCFTVKDNTDFGVAMHDHPNKHFGVSFKVTGDDKDRNIYAMAYTFSTNLECSAVLDKNDMLIPIPVEVSKNFRHEFEEPIYSWGDIRYSEARIPIYVSAGETVDLTILHLYMNWGKYPLKQLSSIQFLTPYYHLSTGVTETNCISNMYNGINNIKNLQMLPDHRAWSAPTFDSGTQHTAGGNHYFLQYTDADNCYYASENICNVINSAGPTYADIDLTYLSDDGKIKATYSHVEFPQNDENRAFYTLKYDILEEISFRNFARDFSFYSVSGYVDYEKLGYLDENGESRVVDVNLANSEIYYKLGKNCPYFDLFKCSSSNDYVNVSFLILDSSFIINGSETEFDFIVAEKQRKARLTLDLEEVTFKAGDSITINAIIMPWGSQITDYNSDEPDANVRRVRENTMLDPLRAEAGENTVVIENTFLPILRSTNGESAELTLSGGENNVVFRVGGFSKLTVPALYEMIGDEWVKIEVSSYNTPDKEGNSHQYDGYSVFYDEDGTYSYSFVVTLTGDESRRFAVFANEDFVEWEEKEDEEITEDPTKVYFDPFELSDYASKTNGGNLNCSVENQGEFLRVTGDGEHVEQYIELNLEPDAVGDIIVLKYRIPKENTTAHNYFQFFIGTESEKVVGNGDHFSVKAFVADGNWQIMLIDASSYSMPQFVEKDGAYYPKYFRFDVVNTKMDTSSYIDVGYLALCSSVDEALGFIEGVSYVTLVKTGDATEIIPIVSEEEETSDSYYDPEEIATAGAATNGGNVNCVVSENGDSVTFIGNGESIEQYITFPQNEGTIGKYIVFKYRIPTENKEKLNYFQFFIGTEGSKVIGTGDLITVRALEFGGEWNVMVIEVESYGLELFVAEDDGNFYPKYLRFDPINMLVDEETALDVEYIALCNTIEEAKDLNSNMSYITLVKIADRTERIEITPEG